MSIFERVISSREHSFIAFRTNALVAISLGGLAVLTLAILPSIIA